MCLTWQITGRCNLSCAHCLAGGGSRQDELHMDEIKDFLDDLAKMKVFYINAGGGEPLLHPRFFEIVDYADEKGIYVQFSTNGTLIDSALAGEIAARGLRVQVSLDGWQPSVNDPIRGAGTFQEAVEALRCLKRKERNGSGELCCGPGIRGRAGQKARVGCLIRRRPAVIQLRPAGRPGSDGGRGAATRNSTDLYRWLKSIRR